MNHPTQPLRSVLSLLGIFSVSSGVLQTLQQNPKTLQARSHLPQEFSQPIWSVLSPRGVFSAPPECPQPPEVCSQTL